MLPVFGVRVSVTFHLTCVHIILVWFRLLSGHLLGNTLNVKYIHVQQVLLFLLYLYGPPIINRVGLPKTPY